MTLTLVINADDVVDRDQSEASTVSVRDRVHEFDVLFQPTPFYHLQRPSLSPWRASPDVAASPTGSATTTTQLPVKAAVTRYDGDMFRRQTPTQVNTFCRPCLCYLFTKKCCSTASVSLRLHPARRRFQPPPSPVVVILAAGDPTYMAVHYWQSCVSGGWKPPLEQSAARRHLSSNADCFFRSCLETYLFARSFPS